MPLPLPPLTLPPPTALPPWLVGPLLVAAERRVAAVGTLRSLAMEAAARALDDVGEPGDEPTDEPDGEPPVEVEPPPACGLAPKARGARSVGVDALHPPRGMEPLPQRRSPQRTTTGAGATNVRVPPPSAVPELAVLAVLAVLAAAQEAALAAVLADTAAS